MALGIVLGIVPLTGGAQTAVPSFKSPLWISGSSIRQAESHNQGTCTVRLLKDEPVTVTSEFPWVTPSVDGQDITLTYTGNQAAGWRNSRIRITRASGTGDATLVFGQPGHPLTQEATEGHTLVRPAAASDNTHQGSSDVSLTLDDNPATIYHSSWNGFDPADETAWPVLVYDFNKPQLIDFINYIPRSGGGNGSFGLVDIYYRTNGAADYVLMGQYDLGMGSSPSRIPTVNGAGVNVESFKFVVRTGACNDKQGKCYASCAEMQFLAAGRDWTRTVPSGAEANSAQPGREIEKSFDNDIGTNWHTAWGSNRFTVSESNPAVITYHSTPRNTSVPSTTCRNRARQPRRTAKPTAASGWWTSPTGKAERISGWAVSTSERMATPPKYISGKTERKASPTSVFRQKRLRRFRPLRRDVVLHLSTLQRGGTGPRLRKIQFTAPDRTEAGHNTGRRR